MSIKLSRMLPAQLYAGMMNLYAVVVFPPALAAVEKVATRAVVYFLISQSLFASTRFHEQVFLFLDSN